MSFDISKLAYLMHLYCDNKEQCIYGTMGELKVYFKYFSNDTTIAVRLFASCEDVVSAREGYTQYSAVHPDFTFIRVWENRTTALFTMPDGINEQSVSNELTSFVKFAADNGFVTQCSTCGSKAQTRLFLFDHEGLCLCEGCSELCIKDVDVTNTLRDRRKPKYLKAVIAAFAVAAVLFLYQWQTAGSSDPLVTNLISGFSGTALSVFMIKKFGGKATKGIAILSIALVALMSVLGSFFWHVDYFTDFNKKQYKDSKFIVDYYESNMDEDEVYDFYMSNPEKSDVISSLFYMSDKELEESYIYNKQITDNQTKTAVIKNFNRLITSEYGDKMRSNFYEYIWGGIAMALLFGVLFWRLVLKTDGGRHKIKPLELDPFNLYEQLMVTQNEK